MLLKFEKWHGCRNDFVVVWISDADGDVVRDSLMRQAVRLCDRRDGIGADGLLILTTKRAGDLTPDRLTIVNSDGTVARNCGNGLRCAASSVLKTHRERGGAVAPPETLEAVELEVEGQAMVARFLKRGAFPFVAVEMGVPTVGPAVPWLAAARAAVSAVAPALARDLAVCEIGNPHLVLTSETASADLVRQIGPALQDRPEWDGMNVHLVRPSPLTDTDQARAKADVGGALAELVTAFVWERGAGETTACGSGACAVAATALATGLVDRRAWFAVDMPGGRLYVRHTSETEPMLLAGPAAFVYAGAVEI